MATVEIFYDFSSPFAYLGATQIERVAAGHRVSWRPFLLGALFKEIGTPMVPLHTFAAAKQAIAVKDQLRWAEHWGVELNYPSNFPQKSVTALRVALQAPDDEIGPLSLALFRIMWVEDGQLEDRAALSRAIRSVGLDPEALLAGAETDAVKAKLRANTEEAVRRGVCGAPTFFVGDLLFWGQDRLDFVKKALDGWVPATDR